MNTSDRQSETHLIVLWEKARSEETRILADIRRHVEVVAALPISWPGDAQECFGRFYGAKAQLAAGKVLVCGGGEFLAVIVKDHKPRYGWRETSRGSERVNLRLFAMKARYRRWTGGGHRIHTTNSPLEARRDIYLLTGRTADEWAAGGNVGVREVLPGWSGWPNLRALFRCLDETVPYVVLRNFEMLPDGFDPSLHGDIDLLVSDAFECAGILGARKVFPEDWRVHYEVQVAGGPVRFDFRFVGDGYYDARWQRDILARRICRDDVCLPSAEDALHMLTYHALLQKHEVAADYRQKVCALAQAAGSPVGGFDEAWPLLEEFLHARRYGCTKPIDTSVLFDPVLPTWRAIVARLEAELPVRDLRLAFLDRRRPGTEMSTLFFVGTLEGGGRCFVKHALTATGTIEAEWRHGTAFARLLPEAAVRPVAYHVESDGTAVIVHPFVEGEMLDERLARGGVSPVQAEAWAREMVRMADALQQLGICHRDVRPGNLIVDATGHLRLIDFQFATELGASRETPFLEGHWKRVLYSLGDRYRVARGLWNDRVSFARSIDELPDFPAKAELRSLVMARAAETMRPVRFRGKKLRRFRRKLFKFRWTNFFRRLRGKAERDLDRIEFLASICGEIPR